MSESNIAKRVECKKFNRFLRKNDKVCFRKNLEQKFAQNVAREKYLNSCASIFFPQKFQKILLGISRLRTNFDS